MFKIHTILPTNNESDILEECIDAVSVWSDYIYVFDTGSTDATWSIVTRISAVNPKVISYLSEYRAFNFTKTVSEVFSHYFHYSQQGDWWCTLCTDEQFLDDPRLFLAKLGDRYDSVWSSTLQYYYTRSDLDLFQSLDITERQKIKHSQRLGWYRNNYSEARFYKHGPSSKFNTILSLKNFPRVSPDRIAMQHFQYRTPEQIVSRVRSRQKIFHGDPLMQFAHEMSWELGADGKHKVDLAASLKKKPSELSDSDILNLRMVPEDLLHQDLKNGKYKFEPDLLPQLPIQWHEPFVILGLLIETRLRSALMRVRNFFVYVAIRFGKSLKGQK